MERGRERRRTQKVWFCWYGPKLSKKSRPLLSSGAHLVSCRCSCGSTVVFPLGISHITRSAILFVAPIMLLGRTALAGKYAVDPKASFLGGRELQKVYKKMKGAEK